jgi:ribonuclease HI
VFEKALGYNPKFSGRIIIPGPNEARDSDSVRLRYDNENLDRGHTVVYWSDGSYNGECLGAGVAWLEGDAYYSQSFKLGKDVGNSADAEIYGIAAALSMAKKEVKRKQEIRLVKVYTDAQWVLEEIRLGYSSNLGPLVIDDDQSALQDIYERAKWLTAKGVDVELIWLKGHHRSKGNIMADEAAGEATKRQMWPKSRLSHVDASHIEDLEIGFRDMTTFSDDSWESEDDRPDNDRSEDDRSEDNRSEDDQSDDDDQDCEPKQHPGRDDVASSLPDLSRIAVEKAIEDIRDKLNSIDAKISKLEEGYIDRHGRVHFGYNRVKLKQLDEQRDQISDSLEAYKALNAIDVKISKLEKGQIDSHGRVHFGFNLDKLKHLDKERERILSSLRVYEAERVAEGTSKMDKSAPRREASSTPTTRSMAPAQQSQEDSDDEDTQYLIDIQIENDMFMAAQYNTCKSLLLRPALLFEYCFARCSGSCFKRYLSTFLSVVRVHLFESLHGYFLESFDHLSGVSCCIGQRRNLTRWAQSLRWKGGSWTTFRFRGETEHVSCHPFVSSFFILPLSCASSTSLST